MRVVKEDGIRREKVQQKIRQKKIEQEKKCVRANKVLKEEEKALTEGMNEVREAASRLVEEKGAGWTVENAVREEAAAKANGEKGQDRDRKSISTALASE